jgi:hypothetical protein
MTFSLKFGYTNMGTGLRGRFFPESKSPTFTGHYSTMISLTAQNTRSPGEVKPKS